MKNKQNNKLCTQGDGESWILGNDRNSKYCTYCSSELKYIAVKREYCKMCGEQRYTLILRCPRYGIKKGWFIFAEPDIDHTNLIAGSYHSYSFPPEVYQQIGNSIVLVVEESGDRESLLDLV